MARFQDVFKISMVLLAKYSNTIPKVNFLREC